MIRTLKIGDWIKADVIGFGFYEVVSIDRFHINLKCLKLFLKGTENRGHVTNCHRGTFPGTKKKIPINQHIWYSQKINKLSN